MKLSRTAPEYSQATSTRKGPEPDGDANDCRVGVTSEAELEGAAFMAYLGRSSRLVNQLRAGQFDRLRERRLR